MKFALILLILFSHISLANEVAVSIRPLELILKEISPKTKTVLLLKSSSDPHLFELSPKDILTLSKSELVLVSDGESWEKEISRRFPQKTVVVPLGSDHGWLSPKRVEKVLPELAKRLSEKGIPTVRTEKFLKDLRALNDLIRVRLSDCTLKVVASDHPFLKALAQDYNLEYLSLIDADLHYSDLKPSKVIRFLKTIKKKNLRSIFVAYEGSNPLKDFATSEGIELISLDPLGYRAKNYHELIINTVESLARVLQCSQ